MGEGFKKAFAITPEERAAMAAGVDVPTKASAVNHLWAPEGHTITVDDATNKSQLASLEAPQNPSARHPSNTQGMMSTMASHAAPAQAQRQATPEDLMAQANEVLDRQRVQHDTLMSQGPSTGARDEAGGKLPEWLTRYMDKEP
jgi:hypothetical protein